MIWLLSNQQYLYFLAVLIGATITTFFLFKFSNARIWKIVDLVWIIFGGLSALSAVIATIYLSEGTSLQREIDAARSKLNLTNFMARSIDAKWCSLSDSEILPSFRNDVRGICERVILISQESEGNAPLFKFVNTLEEKADRTNNRLYQPSELRGIKFEFINTGTEDQGSFPEREKVVEWFHDSSKIAGLPIPESLMGSGIYQGLAIEYDLLQDQYSELNEIFSRLQTSWDEFLARQDIIRIRIFSILLLSLVLPLRIGKSVNELRNY